MQQIQAFTHADPPKEAQPLMLQVFPKATTPSFRPSFSEFEVLEEADHRLALTFGLANSPWGQALVAQTSRGVCHLAFSQAHLPSLQDELVADWPHAILRQDEAWAQDCLRQLFSVQPSQARPRLVLRGSDFQLKVWQALIHTSPGSVLSYRQLSDQIGCPGAQRAVGTALAANRIAYLIPCHRVIRSNGDTGHYRWGANRKRALLAWEADHVIAAEQLSS